MPSPEDIQLGRDVQAVYDAMQRGEPGYPPVRDPATVTPSQRHTVRETAWRNAIRHAQKYGAKPRPHDCWENAVEISTDGPLGHGWECGICHTFLQAG